MKIELQDPTVGYTFKGSAVLKAIQDRSTSLPDLLVRESLQNSLDAGDCDEAPKENCIRVTYQIGSFISSKLSEHLDGIREKLDVRHSANQSCKFLAIIDENTCGLYGKLSKTRLGEDGTLVKLVYDLSNTKTEENTGGAWGLGKTVYFRAGEGLVFYYSRAKDVDGKLQSRLVGCLVERENDENPMLPLYNGHRSSIAWWGDVDPEYPDRTQPVINEKEIQEFLEIFKIAPFGDDESGTAIIIPYLKDLQQDEIDNEGYKPYWCSDWVPFIKHAVQRWYFPRLENQYYEGKCLQVYVNQERITGAKIEPIFRLEQALYNRAKLENLPRGYTDFISEKNLDIPYDNKNQHSYFWTKIIYKNNLGVVGNICLIRVSADIIKRYPADPNNPFDHIGVENTRQDANSVILGFCRKPGMVINYVTDRDPWLREVPPENQGNYIFAFFVLNSKLPLKDPIPHEHELIKTLEGYMKTCEMASHKSWQDLNGKHIVTNLQNYVSSHIRGLLSDTVETIKSVGISAHGRRVASLIFGVDGSGNKSGGGTGSGSHSRKSKMEYKTTNFLQNGSIEYTFSVFAIKSFILELEVESEGGNISANKWEEDTGLRMPYLLSKASIHIPKSRRNDLEDVNTKLQISSSGLISAQLLETAGKGEKYALRVNLLDEESMSMDITLTIRERAVGYRPNFNLCEIGDED